MKPSEILEVLEGYAPLALSREFCTTYDAYDNSGLLLDTGEEVKKIVFALDASAKAIDYAIETGANLIISHHPVIYGKIGKVDGKLAKALKNGISVISMHLNLDCAKGGIDEWLMRGLGGREEKLMQPLSVGGYGRISARKACGFAAFTEEICKEFSAKRVTLYGEEKKIERVASFCGAGADEEAVEFAVREKADVMVSSDFKHHILSAAVEQGLNVVCLTHYASEWYGFQKIGKIWKEQLGLPCEFFTEDLT